MRRITALLIFAIFTLNLGLPFFALTAEVNGVPGIIYVPWKLEPGQIGAVYGGGFSADSIVAIQPLTNLSKIPSPESAKYQIKPFNFTDQFVQFEIPQNIEKDVWGIWVKNNNGWSKLNYANKAQIFWVNEHEIYGGQKLLVAGRNMANPVDNSARGIFVEFVNTKTGQSSKATVSDITEYTVSFKAPNNLTIGEQYKIRYSNGAGGEWGIADMLSEEREIVTVVEYNNNTKYFNDKYDLNISWFKDVKTNNLINIAEFGATGNDESNDTVAIQRALDKAKGDGGGIVFIPKGTYIVDLLKVGANTVLEGESRSESILKWSGADTRETSRLTIRRSAITPDNQVGYGEANKMIYSTASNVGTINFTMISDVKRPKAMIDNEKRLIYGYLVPICFFGGWDVWRDEVLGAGEVSENSSGYVVKNIDMKIVDGSCVDEWAPRHVVIEDNTFDITHYGLEIRGTAYARIRNNVTKNVNRPLMSWFGTEQGGVEYRPDRNWFEGNKLTGDSIMRHVQSGEIEHPGWAELSGATEHRGSDFSGDEYLFVNNTFDGTIGDNKDNSGEGFQGQTGAVRIVSGALGATEDTITSRLPLEGVKILLNQDYIVITDGPGLGQVRMIKEVSGDKLVVDKPWDVVPTDDSAFTINNYIQARLIFSNNSFKANANKGSYHFYRCGFDSVLTDNLSADGGGIWMAAIMTNANRLDFQYFMHVENNNIYGSGNKGHGYHGGTTAIGPGMDGGMGTHYENDPDPTKLSTLMYGIRILHNSLESIGTKPYDKAGAFLTDERSERSITNYTQYSGIVSSTNRFGVVYPATLSEIIDGNDVKNAVAGIHLSVNSAHTVIRNNDLTGNGMEYRELSDSKNTILLEGETLRPPGIYEKQPIDKSMLTNQSGDDAIIAGISGYNLLDFYFEDETNEEDSPALFSDIQGHWARKVIEELFEEGIVFGEGEDMVSFAPDRYVTRAEFITMMVKTAGLSEVEYDGAYYDVFSADSYAGAMQIAKNNLLIPMEMLEYNKAFPSRPITREEAAVIALKTSQLMGYDSSIKISLEMFDDADEIAEFAVDAVKNAYALGIMAGVSLHRFEPKGLTTKAEAAVISKRLLQKGV